MTIQQIAHKGGARLLKAADKDWPHRLGLPDQIGVWLPIKLLLLDLQPVAKIDQAGGELLVNDASCRVDGGALLAEGVYFLFKL